MFFSGITFASCEYTLDPTPSSSNNIDNIQLREGIYDQIFGSSNPNLDEFENKVNNWDYDTFISADFESNIFGGNVNFSIENTDFLRIKRRVKGTYKWVTLEKIMIEKEEDFHFIYYDNLASAKTEYEYAVVPVKNNNEGMMTIGSVYSDFDGVYIVGLDKAYFGFLNLTIPAPTRHKASSVIATLDSRYPTIINNSIQNYYSDNLSATFVEADRNSLWGWDFNDGWRYREEFKDWLYNDKAKIIKYYTGRSWLVGISGDISDKVNQHEENVVTTFTWYEIGDVNDENDLINHGLLEGEDS